MPVSRTPKLFGSSYQPPRPSRTGPLINQSWRAVIIIVVLFLALFLVSRLPVFRLKTVELQGDTNAEVSTGLNNLLGQSIFSRPVSNFIFDTRQNLLVSDFSCRKGIPNALRCNLSLRQPAFIWLSGDKQYLVDQTGLIYGANLPAGPTVLTLTDLQQQSVKPGAVVASAAIIKQYQALITLLKAQSLTVTGLQLKETLYQITALIDRPGKSPVQALFLLSGDVPSQVATVSATLGQHGDTITTYVDARVPGYVYTK